MLSPIKQIIIADDDQDDVQLFQEAIKDTCPDTNLRVATDGLELLTLIDEAPKPDVILLDLNMPCKSGKESLEEIKAKDEFQDIPVVILSTSNYKSVVEYCLKNGASHYFVKPQSYEGMKKITYSICSGSFLSKFQ